MSLLRMLGIGAPPIPQIGVGEAHERRLAGEHLLIDVRAPSEWNSTGRPQGAVGIILQDPQFVKLVGALVDNDKQAPLALTCRTGNRSGLAVRKLQAAGYENVVNVAGGITSWKAAGLPIDPPPF